MIDDQTTDKLESWWNQALAHLTKGEYTQAIPLYQNILKIMPGHADSWHYCGLALYQLKRYVDAEKFYQQALAVKPNDPEIHANIGLLLTATQRYKEAIQHQLNAIEKLPNQANLYLNLGNAYRNNNDITNAELAYQKAVTLDPKLDSAYFSLAEIERKRKNFSTAEKYFSLAIDNNPDSFNCYTKLTTIKKFTKDDFQLIEKLKLLSQEECLSDKEKSIAHFALGKIHNDLKDYHQAFQYYAQGNEMRKELDPYDLDRDIKYMKGIAELFSPEFFKKNTFKENKSHRPVFVVGMPRSGTTLTEQILSSHPEIYGAGELSYMPIIAKPIAEQIINYPIDKSAHIVTNQLTNGAASHYLQQIEQLDNLHVHVVDKMPHNFLHVGLIHILFPNSTIIHIKRNPLDTCLSCYFQNFVPGHGYSDDLEVLGNYYLTYQRLMQHWENVLPGRILTIEYESLIENFEQTTRTMLDRIGVEWSNDCLQHDKNQRVPNTASHWQACQPTYKTSVQRWRNYEPFIQPLIEILGPDCTT